MHARVLKRRTSLEKGVNEFFEAEFRDDDGHPDTKLSIYIVEEPDVRRASVEHWAAAGLDPPSGGVAIDLTGLSPAQVQQSPGNAWFSFTDRAHHEFALQDLQMLLDLAERFLSEKATRQQWTSKQDLTSYVSERKAAADVEWKTFFDKHQKGAKWLRLCRAPTQPAT